EPLEIEYSEEEWDEMVCISSGLWRPSEISGFSSEGGWESTRPLDSSGSFWNVAGTTQMVRKKIGESSSGKSKYFYSISENFDFVNSRYTKGFEEYNYEDDSSVSVYERSISQSLLKILQKALPTYFEGEEPILVYESFGSRYSADEVVLKVRADYVESHGTPMPILTYTVLEED
ncbi:MAG: hypothetical protein KJ566_02650, partial [Nanoarchaeota archaeon]|nr:hypothetical protein [Nanoarchaeota archaeon]